MSERNFKIILSEFLNKHQLKVELLCVSLYFIGIFLTNQEISGGAAMAGFSLTTLAVVYYLSAFVQTGGNSILIIVSNKVIGISSAIAIIGIMFHSLNLNGAKVMLGVGTTSLAIAALLLAISEFVSDEGVQSKAQLIRSALILCYCVFIYLNPPV